MEDKLIQLVIQAGGVGVAVYAIFALSRIIGNHISHSTEALKDLTVVLGELKEIIKSHVKSDI